ncbi:hypothetical protein I546_4589 [Mycobacterium kansasii 732]|nr:hypothetical protein I546_4589 [Mycobacterium kansasii 732]VAZ91463.1 hypothetical protein LAUMK35_01624 [Mycobacterium pseudokansasii]VAZ92411.1 hypothetical protein LAUMK21_01623 [Mycobacterium pseudokansasii]
MDLSLSCRSKTSQRAPARPETDEKDVIAVTQRSGDSQISTVETAYSLSYPG